MYYLVVHVIVEIAHVIFSDHCEIPVDCSATYFIFMNSLFQGIVSTYIHTHEFLLSMQLRLFTCVFERGIFSYKSIPLLYVKLTLRLRPHGHEGRGFFFFFLYHYTLGRGFLLIFFFGIIELWYLNIFRYSVILKIQY